MVQGLPIDNGQRESPEWVNAFLDIEIKAQPLYLIVLELIGPKRDLAAQVDQEAVIGERLRSLDVTVIALKAALLATVAELVFASRAVANAIRLAFPHLSMVIGLIEKQFP
jgi:hypothetical protein